MSNNDQESKKEYIIIGKIKTIEFKANEKIILITINNSNKYKYTYKDEENILLQKINQEIKECKLYTDDIIIQCNEEYLDTLLKIKYRAMLVEATITRKEEERYQLISIRVL